jgi:hypothetical protein
MSSGLLFFVERHGSTRHNTPLCSRATMSQIGDEGIRLLHRRLRDYLRHCLGVYPSLAGKASTAPFRLFHSRTGGYGDDGRHCALPILHNSHLQKRLLTRSQLGAPMHCRRGFFFRGTSRLNPIHNVPSYRRHPTRTSLKPDAGASYRLQHVSPPRARAVTRMRPGCELPRR